MTNACRDCRNSYYRNKSPGWRSTSNGRNKEYRKKYYGDPVRQNKYKNTELLKTYGITLTYYQYLLMEQRFVCAICKGIQKCKRLAIDHDHRTGKIRGLLCERCNRCLGLLKEDPEVLASMIEYIRSN